MAGPDLQAALDALFSATPEQFLQTRDGLVKELKSAGDKKGAAQAKAQHKPTQAAHALNRLARDARPELAALLEASDAVASGKDFKAAVERQRAALAAVAKKATGPDVPAVMAVVRGAQVDAALAQLLKLGRFSKLPEVKVGFFGAAPEGAPSAEATLNRAPEGPTEEIDGGAVSEAEAAAAERAQAVRLEAERKAKESLRLRRELQDAQREELALKAAAADAEYKASEARRRADEAAARVAKLKAGR